MALPAAVPSNSTDTGETTFTVSANGAGALAEVVAQVVVNNTTSSSVLVNAYVVLDLNTSNAVLVDALPLYFPPGQSRDEWTIFIPSLAAGSHTLEIYLNCNVAGVNWVWTRFLGKIIMA